MIGSRFNVSIDFVRVTNCFYDYDYYDFPLVCNSNFDFRRAVFPIFDFKNAVTLKSGSKVTQGHWKCHHPIRHP